MNKGKAISVKDKLSTQTVKTGGTIQVWRQAETYDITELLNIRANLLATISLLESTSIDDDVFHILARLSSETLAGRNIDRTKTFKENIILKLTEEVGDIDWLQSSSSSSSSSTSSNSVSLSDEDKDKKDKTSSCSSSSSSSSA